MNAIRYLTCFALTAALALVAAYVFGELVMATITAAVTSDPALFIAALAVCVPLLAGLSVATRWTWGRAMVAVVKCGR